jgi:hypothetical protein
MTLPKVSLIDLLQNGPNENHIMTKYEPKIFQNSSYYKTEAFLELLHTKLNTFKILSLNCQSIYAKFEELRFFIEHFNTTQKCNIGAICLQETWLSENDDLSLLQIEGYNLITKGKESSEHGGVAIYLQNSIEY